MPVRYKEVKGDLSFFGFIWRLLFWGWQALMFIWLLSYTSDVSPLVQSSQSTWERAGAAIGLTIGWSFIFFFWVGGTVILGLFVLMTRRTRMLVPREEGSAMHGRVPCPFCAELIREEALVCPYCHNDLAKAGADDAAGEVLDLVPSTSERSNPKPKRKNWTLVALLVLGLAGGATLWLSQRPQPETQNLVPISNNSAEIRELQADLSGLGYDVGPHDGVLGSRTRRALEQWQASHSRKPDGRLTRDLLDAVHADALAHTKPAQSL